jgi:hypothetical protein
LERGTYRNALVAREAALSALRRYIVKLDRQCEETVRSNIALAQNADDEKLRELSGEVESASTKVIVKKIIWEWEKALLRSLERERGKLW